MLYSGREILGKANVQQPITNYQQPLDSGKALSFGGRTCLSSLMPRCS